MRGLNVAVRVCLALVFGALSLGPLAGILFVTMKIMADPSRARDARIILALFPIGVLFAWGAYSQAKAARRIWTEEKAEETAASTRSFLFGAAVVLLLGTVVYRKFIMFVPGQGLFRAALGRQTVGQLGAIRSSLSIYYGDMEGQYPADLTALIGRRWGVEKLPLAETGMHPRSDAIQLMTSDEVARRKFRDDGGWYYVTDGMNAGNIGVNCVHTDVKGKSWNDY